MCDSTRSRNDAPRCPYFDAIISVNLRGPFMLCRAAVRQMLTQPPRGDARGRIVNITSQHGMVGAPGHCAYAISKGALVQFTRQIAVEHGRDGIICNAVAPGKIVTGAVGDLDPDAGPFVVVTSVGTEEQAIDIAHGAGIDGVGGIAQGFDGGDLSEFGDACEGVEDQQIHGVDNHRRVGGVLAPGVGELLDRLDRLGEQLVFPAFQVRAGPVAGRVGQPV